MILTTIAQTVTRARAEYESKYARRKNAEESGEPTEAAAPAEVAAGIEAVAPQA